ncbi:MAG: hypothetical protein L0216_00315 [Planctomycetales bacterium]|nr:hypothetical protein [Planctomycetales bacterium]
MPEPLSEERETRFDTEIFGLKYDLISHLTEEGFGWFVDYTDVECCLAESELKLTLLCPFEQIRPALRRFCRRTDFALGNYDPNMGYVYLVRNRNREA